MFDGTGKSQKQLKISITDPPNFWSTCLLQSPELENSTCNIIKHHKNGHRALTIDFKTKRSIIVPRQQFLVCLSLGFDGISNSISKNHK